MDLENVIDIEVENVSDGIDTENVDDFEIEVQESGPPGEQGVPGLSAYEIYSTHGGTLSEEDWLESLKGATGEPGRTPVKGEDYFTDDDIATLAIPRKTSEVENDSGFIAEIPDEYAKKEYVDEVVSNIEIPDKDPIVVEFTADCGSLSRTGNPATNVYDSVDFTSALKPQIDVIMPEALKAFASGKLVKLTLTGQVVTNEGSGFRVPLFMCAIENLAANNFEFKGSLNNIVSNAAFGQLLDIRGSYNKEQNTFETTKVYYSNKNVIDVSSYAKTSTVLTKTNTTSFTPTGDYHPATKKYVDDAVANIDIPGSSESTESIPIIYVNGDIYHSMFTKSTNASLWFNADANFETRMKEMFTKYKTKLLKEFYIMPDNDRTTSSGNKKLSFIHFKTYAEVIPDTMDENKPVEFIADVPHYANPQILLRYILSASFSYDSSGNYNGSFSSNVKITARTFLTTTNTTSYTPTGDYNPATKKYVDDTVKAAIATALEGEY